EKIKKLSKENENNVSEPNQVDEVVEINEVEDDIGYEPVTDEDKDNKDDETKVQSEHELDEDEDEEDEFASFGKSLFGADSTPKRTQEVDEEAEDSGELTDDKPIDNESENEGTKGVLKEEYTQPPHEDEDEKQNETKT